MFMVTCCRNSLFPKGKYTKNRSHTDRFRRNNASRSGSIKFTGMDAWIMDIFLYFCYKSNTHVKHYCVYKG